MTGHFENKIKPLFSAGLSLALLPWQWYFAELKKY